MPLKAILAACQLMCKWTVPDLISQKRDGLRLTKEAVQYFVDELVKGNVQKAQLGAMLMAMFIRGLDNDETTNLTRAMTHSGEVLRWPNEWKGRIVDKHSTGGVGDKVSLVLAPALAACGMKVPMVSGRGLGHTGGTLDKLEAIPGFTVDQSHEAMLKILTDVGCCIVGQTSNLVPADKIMYATRDVTSTTENIGLITSSIISKKVAESLDVLVLDVKIGRGAFLKTEKDARELADRMVQAGNGSGVKTVALMTDMDSPIGLMIGNSLEVAESIQCLKGNGPKDLTDLVVKLGGQVLYQAEICEDVNEANDMVTKTLKDGSALLKFCAMCKAQGVDPDKADSLCLNGKGIEILPKAKYQTELTCPESGFVLDIDPMKCAIVSGKLGAGRTKAGEAINYAVGLQLRTSVGEKIEKDTTWVVVHHDEADLGDFLSILHDAIVIGDSAEINKDSRVMDILT